MKEPELSRSAGEAGPVVRSETHPRDAPSFKPLSHPGLYPLHLHAGTATHLPKDAQSRQGISKYNPKAIATKGETLSGPLLKSNDQPWHG